MYQEGIAEMSDPSWELQVAIFKVLKPDTELQALMAQRWFDYIPKKSAYPYGRYEEEATAEYDTSETGEASGFGKEHLISIHVFDDYEGTKRIRAILGRVNKLLQNNTAISLGENAWSLDFVNDQYTVGGEHTLVSLLFTASDVVSDPDGQTYHGIAQYRAVTEEN